MLISAQGFEITCHLLILKYIKIILDKLIINGKLGEWKHLKTVIGKTEVTLPNLFSELFIIVRNGNDNTTTYTFVIPQICLSNTARNFVNGHGAFAGGKQYNGFVRIGVTMTRVNLISATGSSGSSAEDNTEKSQVEIYYK